MELREFLDKLVVVLRANDLGALNQLVKAGEDSEDIEILYYLWLLYHPEGTPYLDESLESTYAEIADLSKANNFGNKYFQKIKAYCESGQHEYMSRLSELYLEGCGCEVDKNASRFWQEKSKNA